VLGLRADLPGMNEAGKPKSVGVELVPPKIKAEDNPWYLLATIYGVPGSSNNELRAKKRIAWNRYFAANLDEETRARLIEEKRHSTDELTPFSTGELEDIQTAFAERCKAVAKNLDLPKCDRAIHFDGVQFDEQVDLAGHLFTGCSFKDATFADGAKFTDATFSRWSSFENATFNGRASFAGTSFAWENITFTPDTNFAGTTFSGDAYFLGASFSGSAWFKGAAFSLGADFGYVTFAHGAFFDGTMFSCLASFPRAAFSGTANFNRAAFGGFANFVGTTFSGGVHFTETMFEKSASFVNAKMKLMASFECATFKLEPPKFFGAKLHQGTVWRGITWPFAPKDNGEAGRFIDAYECLKLEMERLKKHEDELDFFALELQSRRVLLGPWLGWPIWLYGVLSSYGRSYMRPLGALFMVTAIGTWALWYFDARTYGEALGLSAANTLNVFGFRKDFGLAIDTPFAWLEVMSAIQTIFGTILLFLFGLGIRNKFRMK
jgi:hypothetical protein